METTELTQQTDAEATLEQILKLNVALTTELEYAKADQDEVLKLNMDLN